MKIKSAIISAVLLTSTLLNAQVLLNDNFNNYTLGNLGTDPNGVIPGQGGWLTLCGNTKSNSFFSIVNEANRGKVFDLTTNYTKNTEVFGLIKPNLDVLIDTRTPGNDVIKFEIDFFTGNRVAIGAGLSRIKLNWKNTDPIADDNYILQLLFRKQTGEIKGQILSSQSTRNIIKDGSNGVYLPFVTWITFVVYLDYPNNKIYIEVPYLNKVFSAALRDNNTNIQDYKPIALTMATGFQSNMNYNVFSNHRYDNIKITALKEVPPEVINLNTNEQLTAKFNIYPNPATNVVNITNTENMFVEQVAIYDVAGKLLNTQNFTNEAQIQLNIENLAIGTYMLHLKTNEGIAVKKLVKK